MPIITEPPTRVFEQPVHFKGTANGRTLETDGATLDAHVADDAAHRVINDAGTSATETWSASKTSTQLATKAPTSHAHTAADITDFQTSVSENSSVTTVVAHAADASKHRLINDAGSGTTDLWSASKLVSELALKASVGLGGSGVRMFDVYDGVGGDIFDTGTITLNLDTVRTNTGDFSVTDDVITVTSADTYVILVRVTTDVHSGSSRSVSCCWLERDQGSGFVEVPGSQGFMYNRLSPEGDNTATVPLILSCGSGDTLRVQVKRHSGYDFLKTVAFASSVSMFTAGGKTGPAGPAVDIGSLPVMLAVDGVADYLMVRDATDGLAKKLLLNNLPTPKTMRLPHAWCISGEIKQIVADKNVLLPFCTSFAAEQTAATVKAIHYIKSGTSVTLSVQKNGVAIGGTFTDIVVTQTKTVTTLVTAETLAEADELGLLVSGVSGTPKNMTFTLFVEYSVT